MNGDLIWLTLWVAVLVIVVPGALLSWIGVIGDQSATDFVYILAVIPAVLGINHHWRELIIAETGGSGR